MPRRLSALLLAIAIAPAMAQDAPPQKPAPKMSAAECEVWSREKSFAATVEAHDAAAFKAHLHPGAVFFGGPDQKLIGADAVTEGWKSIIDDGPQPLRWYPRMATIGGDPDIAHSIGPYWIEDTTPGAKQRYLVGQFISIWRRVDGEWKVLFDGGGGGQPRPATEAEVAALKASLASECPRA